MVVFDFGISAAVARQAAMFADDDNFQSNIGSLLRTGELLLLLIVTCIIFSFYFFSDFIVNLFLSGFKENNRINVVVFLMGATISGRIIEGVYKGLLLGLQRHVTYNVLFILQSAFRWMGAAYIVSTFNN